MHNALTLTPLFRRTIGFDRFNDLFESALRGEDTSNHYPSYNILKTSEHDYRIVLAVPGFSEGDLSITTQGNALTIAGGAEDTSQDSVEYLHKGFASRAFTRSFTLADHVQVVNAQLKDGLLTVELKREIPEEAKARSIPINSDAVETKKINGKKVN